MQNNKTIWQVAGVVVAVVILLLIARSMNRSAGDNANTLGTSTDSTIDQAGATTTGATLDTDVMRPGANNQAASVAGLFKVQTYYISNNNVPAGTCSTSVVATGTDIKGAGTLSSSVSALLANKQAVVNGNLANPAAQATLTVQDASVVNGIATINLAGALPTDACAQSQIGAQLRATARQFPSVTDVSVFVNGKVLN